MYYRGYKNKLFWLVLIVPEYTNSTFSETKGHPSYNVASPFRLNAAAHLYFAHG